MRYMRKSIIWMMLLMFCSGAVFAQKAERKHLREGNGLYNKKKYTEAEIAYRKGLEVNPRSVEGTYNLGNALYKQKKYSEAGQQYQLLAGRAEKIAKTPDGKARLAQVFHNMWLFSGKIIWLPLAVFILCVLVYKKNWRESLLILLAITLTITLCDQFASHICKPYFMRFRPTHHPDFMYQVKTVFDYRGGMTILKGAAATALYGSRAASGVIMITTKSGKLQKKGLGVEYNGGLQWETLLRIPELQNEFGMGWYGNKTLIENGSWGPRLDGSMQLWGNVYDNSQKLKPFLPMENNVKDFFDTGVRYNNSISFNGASEKSTYFVSFSQISDDGMIPTNADSYNKYTFSTRGSHKVGHLTFSSSVNYAYQKNKFVSTGQGKTTMYNSIMYWLSLHRFY